MCSSDLRTLIRHLFGSIPEEFHALEHDVVDEVVRERIENDLAVAVGLDHARILQKAKLVTDRRLIDAQNPRNVRDAHFGDGERGQDADARRVGENGKKAHQSRQNLPFGDVSLDHILRASVQEQGLHTAPPCFCDSITLARVRMRESRDENGEIVSETPVLLCFRNILQNSAAARYNGRRRALPLILFLCFPIEMSAEKCRTQKKNYHPPVSINRYTIGKSI